MWILLVIIRMALADCHIPAPPAVVEPGTCSVTANHLEQLKEFYSCQESNKDSNPEAVSACQKQAKKLSAAALSMIPAKMQLGMSSAEKAKAVADFLASDEAGLIQDIAEEQFKRDNHKPADPKLLRKLRKEHRRLKMKVKIKSFSKDPKVRRQAQLALEKFESDRNHRSLLRAIEAHNGKISSVNVPRPRYTLRDLNSGGDLTGKLYDIANMDFKDVPVDIVEHPSQRHTLVKQAYFRSANRTFASIKSELLKGKSLRQISELSGNNQDIRNASRIIEKRALASRDRFSRSKNGKFRAKGASDSGQGKKKGKTPWLKKALSGTAEFVKKAGPVAGLLAAAYGVASIPWSKQENCDKVFPFYPVDYSPSAVVGLPEESNCKTSLPGLSEKAPDKIKRFLALPSSEQNEVLIDRENRKTRSACRYYRNLYNHLICNGKDSSGTSPDSLMIDN